jgi:hypothetical protein
MKPPPPEIPIVREDYEKFVYAIREHYPDIQVSTLVVKMIASQKAEVVGAIFFHNDIRLEVTQSVSFDQQAIEAYGYEVYRGEEKLYWYDSQPHLLDPSLQSTHPHHKHVPPNIKHHRLPAPGLNFTRANLPFLVEEIQSSLLADRSVEEGDGE